MDGGQGLIRVESLLRGHGLEASKKGNFTQFKNSTVFCKMGHYRPLFLQLCLFNIVDSKCSI